MVVTGKEDASGIVSVECQNFRIGLDNPQSLSFGSLSRRYSREYEPFQRIVPFNDQTISPKHMEQEKVGTVRNLFSSFVLKVHYFYLSLKPATRG
jgi:hypothetical protein